MLSRKAASLEARPRVLYFVTEDWYFWSHRLSLARAAKKAGFGVTVITRVNKHRDLIENEGFTLIPIRLVRSSKNLASELLSILEIIRIYRRQRPDITHHVALKPILYGTWAAMLSGRPCVINLFAGVTTKFHAQGWKSVILGAVVNNALRLGFLGGDAFAVFQNRTDKQAFLDKGIVREARTSVISGSGVDPSRFTVSPEPEGVPLVVLASRMLWDKGVGEFVEAARVLKDDAVLCRMVLVGDTDPENPVSIPEEVLRDWASRGIVEWWGYQEEIPRVFAAANIVCLPSYHEGCPKVLIEAAACGRAIVASDDPGCREVVSHGDNGLLVPVKDSGALADAIRVLAGSPETRRRMGRRGREIAVQMFSEDTVVDKTLNLYRRLLETSHA